MMKPLRIILVLLALVIVVGFFAPVRGQGTGFIITSADDTNTLSFTPSTVLGTLINQVAPRFVVEFANTSRYYTLTPIPAQLNTLLVQVAPRFVLEFANTNRNISLNYPTALINDTTPPQISAIETETAGTTSTNISWTTDEYATSTVKCGTQPGIYTINFSTPLYVKLHTVTVMGLTAGSTYYCRISGADLSGNTSQSQEFAFEQVEESFTYLPLVIR